MSSTILNLTQRSSIDGTEWLVLATTGANWKAQLGTQTWVLGGLTVNGLGTFTAATTAGTGVQITTNQSVANAGDTSDSVLNMQWTLTASSATNELICRAVSIAGINNLTGGGHIQNLRLFHATPITQAGAVTDTSVAYYIDGVNSGTVTTAYGIYVNAVLGTTKWGIYDPSGANEYFGGAVGVGTTNVGVAGSVYTNAASPMIGTRTTYTNGAGTGSGVTFTNAPGASGSTGNPTKWIPVDDNGTTRYIPAF